LTSEVQKELRADSSGQRAADLTAARVHRWKRLFLLTLGALRWREIMPDRMMLGAVFRVRDFMLGYWLLQLLGGLPQLVGMGGAGIAF
jgi:hypothetical protein